MLMLLVQKFYFLKFIEAISHIYNGKWKSMYIVALFELQKWKDKYPKSYK